MLAKFVEAGNDWVVADDGPPEAVVVVGVCRAATLDKLVMTVVELGVGAVPVGVKVVVRGKVVAVDDDPPEDFMDVKDWVEMMVAAPPVLGVVASDWFELLVAVVSARDTMLPIVVGDGSVIDVVIPEVVETRVTLAVPAVGVTPAIDSLPIVYKLDVETVWPDTNIDVRSIPRRSRFKMPSLPGIIVKKKTTPKNKI